MSHWSTPETAGGPPADDGADIPADSAAVGEALAAVGAMRAQIAAFAQLGRTAHEARSADGSVTVAAVGGRLRRVEIDPLAFERSDRATLTASVLAAARAALLGPVEEPR